MRDTHLLFIAYAIGMIAVPWGLCRFLQSADNPRDEDADRQRLIVNRVGRVPLAPGSHPSGHAASGVDGASRFDPSRGGVIRAFNGE